MGGRRIDLTGPPRLQPSEIRRIARAIGPSCTEIDLGYGDLVTDDDDDDNNNNDAEWFSPFKVLSFLVEEPTTAADFRAAAAADDDGGADPWEQSVARINIYYQTGTVAVCRALNGEVRQVFRRRCHLAAVERMLRDPPQLTLVGLGASLVDEAAYEVDGDAMDDDDDDDEAGAKELRTERQLHRDMDLCDTAVAILRGELEWIRGQGAALEEAQLALADAAAERAQKKMQAGGDGEGNESEEEEDDDDEEEENDDGGSSDNDSLSSRREFEFNLPQDTVADVETFLADSTNDPVRCVAINGIGAVLIYQSGEWAYSSDGLPKKLKKALNVYGDDRDDGAAGEKRPPPPRYAALGTEGRYFLAFGSGGQCGIWNGPPGLDEALTSGVKKHDKQKRKQKKKNALFEAKRHRPVSSVAFGTKMDTWFVVFKDGSWEYRGKGIPEGLERLLQDRRSKADLETVTLGPSGEWFVKARNGKMWWGGTSDDFDELMDYLEESERSPTFVDFGQYNAYFVTHE